MSDTCRSCKALIRWVISGKSGLRMPVDLEPSPNGNLYIKASLYDGVTTAYVIGAGERRALQARMEAYISHHATCPRGREWRKSRTKNSTTQG